MNRDRRIPLFAAALALLLPTLAAAAPPRPPASPASILNHPRALARFLRLTPAQIAQQKALLEDLRGVIEPLREQQKPLAESLRTALQGASPQACEVGALVVEIDQLGDQIRAAREDYEEAFVAILTPQQLARYNALKELVDTLHEGD